MQNGGAIPNCRIGYRTFGTLNGTRDNAVLIPTWFTGRSAEMTMLLGPAALVDTTRFYTILVDALGNGVSSSPSNTVLSPPSQFPAFTIRDMVQTQYRLLTEHLGLRRLHAVLGGSMGGMQVFEWGVAYPEFVDRLVAITGSPLPGTYDRINWTTQLSVIEQGRRYRLPDDTIFLQLVRVSRLVSLTPAKVNELSPVQTDSFLRASARGMVTSLNLEDYASQLRAMLTHDVSKQFQGDMQRAALHSRRRSLVVYSPDDHVVTFGPAASFARQLGADTLSIASVCGHAVFVCEWTTISSAVRAFLTK